MPDLPPPPVLEGTAEIDADLWMDYAEAAYFAEVWKDNKRQREAQIRELAGPAKYLAVDGKRVATRVIQDAIGVTFRKDFYQRTRSHD